MPERKAMTSQPVIGAYRVELVSGYSVNTDSAQHAGEISAALNAAYAVGRRDAQSDMRKALGLRDWDGDVKIES